LKQSSKLSEAIMTIIERAPLPPMKRGRKPKCVTCAEVIKPDPLTGTTCACVRAKPERTYFASTPSSLEDGWVSNGWTVSIERTVLPKPATVATRFPPEGLDLLMGGPFNGEYRDMRQFANDFFACFAIEDELEVHYYERGDVFGWVWAASIYPSGIEIRERYDV
jgi:hypothetical protein